MALNMFKIHPLESKKQPETNIFTLKRLLEKKEKQIVIYRDLACNLRRKPSLKKINHTAR